jgi:hypothetical protein
MTSFKVDNLKAHYKTELISLAKKHEQTVKNLINTFPVSYYFQEMLDEEYVRYDADIDQARRKLVKDLNGILGSLDEKDIYEMVRCWEDEFLLGKEKLPESFLAPF